MKLIIICIFLFAVMSTLYGQKKEKNETLLTSITNLTDSSLFIRHQLTYVNLGDSSKQRGCSNYHYELCPLIWTSGVRMIENKFKNYNELNQKHVALLNRVKYFANTSIGSYYQRIYCELGFSFCEEFAYESDNIDSVNIKIFAKNTYLTLGYGLPYPKLRLILTPYFSLNKILYRYNTYNKDTNITLTQYLKDTNYDLKFIEWVGILGANFDVGHFKERKNNFGFLDLSIGAGYIFKFSNKPAIKSVGNKINSPGHIDYNNLFLQASLKICFSRRFFGQGT